MTLCARGIAQGRVSSEELEVAWGSQPDYDKANELALLASGENEDEATAHFEWLRQRAFNIIWRSTSSGTTFGGRASRVSPSLCLIVRP